MKITDIKTFICHAYRTNWVFVKVYTDSGLYGVGEATLEMRELTVMEAISEIKRGLVGKDPENIEGLWLTIYRDTYWRGGPVLMSALAGVEMALWDIKGKSLGVPVYQLLGGKVRDKAPCYANGWFAGARTPQKFAQKAKETIQLGFQALKWDPFGSAYLNLSAREFQEALRCIAAIREAVGSEVDLIIEGHGRFNLPTAKRLGHAMKEFQILWFEEPLCPESHESLADLRQQIPIPVAAGERIYSRWDFYDFLTKKSADIIQPDVSHVGGIMEMKKIAAMAECCQIPLCPHNPSGPVAHAATLHLAACITNFYLLETMSADVDYRNQICTENLLFEDGMIHISNEPGLGIDINEDAILNYPYKPCELRHYNGDLTEIRPRSAKMYMQRI